MCCVANDEILFHRFQSACELHGVLSRQLPFLLLSALAMNGLAQDPLKRMDPDVWLSRPGVLSMLEWADACTSRDALTVFSNEGSMHAPMGSGGNVLVREGDLRVVLDSLGINRSTSHNLGFNLSAKHFSHNGRLFSLGGRGFWNAHAKLIEFIPKTGEWELVMMEPGPDCVTVRGSFFDGENDVVYAIEEGQWGRTAAEQDVVWKLDLEGARWTRLGIVSPRLQLFSRGVGQIHDLREFTLWLGSHQSAILRKADGRAVMTDRWNLKEFTRVRARMQNAEMAMLVVDGNQLRALVREESGEEEILLNWNAEDVFLQEQGSAVVMDWILPVEEQDNAKDSGARAEGEGAGMPNLAFGLVLLFIAGGGFLLGKQASANGLKARHGEVSKRPSKEAIQQALKSEKGQWDGAVLDQLEQLEQLGARIMSTEEINQFLDLGGEVSSESRRAKRAQFIRDVNRAYQMRHGKDLIVREKDLNDRRRTIYVIHPHSGTA